MGLRSGPPSASSSGKSLKSQEFCALPNNAVIIAGYYGFGNAGDELILYSLIQRLRKINPRVLITVLSHTPRETRARYQVHALNRWRPWRWIPALLRSTRFILGGGGLLQEFTGPWNHAYYLSLLMAAKIFRCRTDVVAIGVDPIHRPFNRFLTCFVLDHFADSVSVRDEESREILVSAGVRTLITIERDPVFDLQSESPATKSGRIAVALSRESGQLHSIPRAAEFCDFLAKHYRTPVDLLVFYPKQDEAFARSVAAASAITRRVRVWRNPIEVLSWIPEYQLIVSTRFHALVLAAAAGVPFVGMGTQKKVHALCRSLKRPWWILRPDGSIEGLTKTSR